MNQPINDGSTFEKAIVVSTVEEEYRYVKQVCAECEFIRQSLASNNGKPYDILEFKKPEGETVFFYFDISNFFGK